MVLLDKIYCAEDQIECANKALRLNGGSDYDPGLLDASSLNRKPTLKITRLSFSGPGIKLKLKGPSNIQRQLLERQRQIEITEQMEIEIERINAEKALRLNS
jgi:hypothetical protein